MKTNDWNRARFGRFGSKGVEYPAPRKTRQDPSIDSNHSPRLHRTLGRHRHHFAISIATSTSIRIDPPGHP